MKNKNIDSWIVLEGRIVYSCRTRKQARAYAKKYPAERGYNYVGKCIKNYRNIVLDV